MLGWESKPGEHRLAMWLWCNVSTVDAYGLGQGRNLGCGHPFARAMGAWSGVRARGVNHNGDRAEIGGSDNLPAARVLRPRCSRRRLTVG